jgi:FtsP/CotA-like multicopper oxidase with cupredoxin domain
MNINLLKYGFTFSLLIFAQLNFAAEKTEPVKQTVLIIKKAPLTVNGHTSTVFKIEQPDGTWGYRGVKGDIFDAIVKNTTDEPTVLHWHGLIVPNAEDGVPGVTQAPIPPGGQYHYHFKLNQAGTYWMHSHYQLQEQELLSAPFIILDPKEKKPQQDITVFLSDFSKTQPKQILADLKKGMNHGDMSSMDMGDMTDLNDVQYDALLTNYRTLKNPEIVQVKPGDVVRLRFIAGSAMSNFLIQLGPLEGMAIAVDGQNIIPFKMKTFELAAAQRLDVLVKIPKGIGAYPILAQGEGTNLQTGLILATQGATIPKLKETADSEAKAFTYDQEFRLQTRSPLVLKRPDKVLTVDLEGDMMKYDWTLNGKAWPKGKPLQVNNHDRVEMIFNNKSDMAHPMHLHGHFFEVKQINGRNIQNGAIHDTILVLPHSTVKIQFDADNPGNWPLHCHMLYHMASGMMTMVEYTP